MLKMKFTLVSGFIDRTRYDPGVPKRPVDFYLEHGRALLALPVPKVIFLEEHIATLLAPVLANAPTTHVVITNKESMQYWPVRDRMLACPLPPGANPEKDTHDYFILMLNKLQWCCQAAGANPWGTETFVWMDFGINYILKGSLEDAVRGMQGRRVPPGQIHIPGCYVNQPCHPAQLVWHFCGGLLGGGKEALERFRALQDEVVYALLESGWVSWEVTVWYHVSLHAPDLFDWYAADHNDTMLTHY